MEPYTGSSSQHPYGSSERRSLTGGGEKAGPIGTNVGFWLNNFFFVGRVVNTFESAHGERLLLQFLDRVQVYMRRHLCTPTNLGVTVSPYAVTAVQPETQSIPKQQGHGSSKSQNGGEE